MHRHMKYRNNLLPCIALIILLAAFFCTPVRAGLSVAGGKYMGEIAPGETYVHTFTVSTEPTDDPVDIVIDVLGFGQGADLSYIGLPPGKDTGQYSARPFITIDTSTFTLKPGESRSVKATIAVPNNVGAGGRYALINIHNKPAGGGLVSISSAIGAPMMVTIKGQPVIETGYIADIKAVLKQDGKTAIVTTFKNTGNHHYYGATNAVTITDASGKQVTSVTLDPSLTAIIPEATVLFEAVTPIPLQQGMYTAESKVTLPNGTLLDSKKMTVEVTSTSAQQTLIIPVTQRTPDSASSAGPNSDGVNIIGQNSSSQIMVKKTYSPGPSPLMTFGVFAVVFLLKYRKK
jgi:hypothetical protein